MKADIDLSEFGATDREECGILIGAVRNGERVVTRVVKVHNYAKDPFNDYAVAMLDVEKVAAELEPGEHIVGFLHTHLDRHGPRPTKSDFEGAKIFPNYLNVVYKPSTGELVWYTSTNIRSSR
jgi:proteasome lid subunit RPN8/RPN11